MSTFEDTGERRRTSDAPLLITELVDEETVRDATLVVDRREDSARETQQLGTGLGLFIARQIVSWTSTIPARRYGPAIATIALRPRLPRFPTEA